MDYNKKLSIVFAYLFYSCLCSRYASPQLSIDWMIGRMDSPNSVREYSTRVGTSGKTVRFTMPSSSMERNASVNAFWLMPSMLFCSSLKRQGLESRLRMISSFHLLPIRETVIATGHSGRIFSFDLIGHTTISIYLNAAVESYCNMRINARSFSSGAGYKKVRTCTIFHFPLYWNTVTPQGGPSHALQPFCQEEYEL